MKEENPVFLAQASSPARMGFQESSLNFRAEGKALEHPSEPITHYCYLI